MGRLACAGRRSRLQGQTHPRAARQTPVPAKHKYRAENWTVVQGVALVQVDEMLQTLKPGEMATIPLGAKHRLSNPGDTELIIVEVQRGASTAEEDIKRYEDDFGRS